MMQFRERAKFIIDPEQMAAEYLRQYYGSGKIEYPINPFKMLKDEGILFAIMNFKKLEGVYIPPTDETDIPTVGINANRPITRQRFTAAHELCHHFRDADKHISCPIYGKKNSIERFADSFAAALLMPIEELKNQVTKRSQGKRYISFDSVLEIADYFGVSFESCLFRIAYKIHAIDGISDPKELKKRANKFKPDKVRKARHMTYCKLYEDLIDCCQEQFRFEPSDFAKLVFQNNYIYNDSRMEGVSVTAEQAAEIVTDVRLNQQNNDYCTEENETFLSIAGHFDMYQEIFAVPVRDTLSVFEIISLNRILFSHYPNPDYGGNTRATNTLVLGRKFETSDYRDIIPELLKVDSDIRDYYLRRAEIPMSEYVKHVVRTHHRITVIHPFPDGNGRTARAFMNMQLVRSEILPIYIKVEDKDEYENALGLADKEQNYDELYEIVFRLIMRSFVELNKQPPL